MDFVSEVERVTGRQIETVDIGGGLSTSYTEPAEPEQGCNSIDILDSLTPSLNRCPIWRLPKHVLNLVLNPSLNPSL